MSSINVDTIKSRLGGPPTLSNGVVVSAAATFSGDVSIGGTITYEDVTNVDSVGLITARSGIEFGASGVGGTITAAGNAAFENGLNVKNGLDVSGISTARGGIEIGASGVGGTISAGGNVKFTGITTVGTALSFTDDIKAKFGAGGDLSIYHDGSHSYISETGTGALKIKGDDIRLENASGNNIIKANTNVAELFNNGSKKLETTSSGTITTGVSTVTSTIYVNTNGSSIAENNLNFASSGKAYIDHRTTGQDIDFRVSHGSALDRTAITVGSAGITTFYDTPHDGKGSLRNIPARVESSGVTLTAADAGKVVATSTGNFIIPAGTFTTQGMTVTLLNRSNSTQTINATALTTLYNTADGANVKDSTLTLV